MRRILAVALKAIGCFQCVVGVTSSVFAYLLYAVQNMQKALDIHPEEVPLFMFLFLLFGIFSVISGATLLRK